MEENKAPVRQLTVLVFCGLLSPIIRLVLGETGYAAGAGGWLSPMIALPIYLLPVWVLIIVFRRLPKGTGLSGLYQLAFGKRPGKALTLMTGLWALLAAALALRFYVESMVSSVYADTSVWLFLAGLMAVVWYVCVQGRAAVCRMVRLFLPVLGITVGLILLLGVREMHLYHVWPVWLEGADGLLRSAVPVTVVLGYSIPVLFLRGEVGETQEGRRVVFRWMTGLCLLMSAAGLIILGMFGWKTAVRLQMPFFSVAKEVSVLNVIERVESVVAAVWALSDIALIAALMDAAADCLQKGAWPVRRNLLFGGAGIVVLLLAAFVGPSAFELRNQWVRCLQYVDGAVCYALPLAACGTAWARKRI